MSDIVPQWLLALSPVHSRIFESLLVVLLFVVVRSGILRLVGNRVSDLRARLAWRQSVTFVLFVLCALLLIRIWFVWFQSILTLLSVVAAALVIVSKELIANFTSSGIILWRALFEVGDRIQIGKTTGDVVEIGLFYITLAETGAGGDEATGRIVKVPNSSILGNEVANFSRGLELVWHEIVVPVAADKNWQRARVIAEELLEEHAAKITDKERRKLLKLSEEIMYTGKPARVYVRLAGEKIELTLRFLVKIHKRRVTEHRIWEGLLTRFTEEGDILGTPSKKEAAEGKSEAAAAEPTAPETAEAKQG
ncbi:mechanosensitive ion channel family protein [Acanthopleuribacter pedis]|uniref:Mechanosensitive ion channel n=1 Tax=Acanthopleuribacter pedis TaxID=442870 RepID=A0A8J7QR70_9BACT|nr:mechanosensitive ion channel domain-containing protein [Acanthopleuribacter pedis]MBO1322705.1 mechanosensitive ion channel [Acanthopleuribacter pedis]